ncbi:hypothetical protein BC834DRAFT_965161 [Gloeopeniophorella convolvens]|nr:hypothetical protein BC834DRAFT_965161 [Gloeopeniophorella convolvens]
MMDVPSPTPSFPGAWPDLSEVTVSLSEKSTEPDAPTAGISPTILCLSPRPLPELPSLSSSLTTAASSATVSSVPAPEQPPSPVKAHEPSPISVSLPPSPSPSPPLSPSPSPSVLSPYLLDLPEPRSPDSAHFSPVEDLIAFSSPSSSQLHLSLSLPSDLPRTPSLESAVTCLPLPETPTIAGAVLGRNDVDQSHGGDPESQAVAPCTPTVLQECASNNATQVTNKRTLLGRVKRFGGRVKNLFKVGTDTRPRRNSVSSLVSSRKRTLPVSVRLPAATPDSPSSRQGSEPPQHIPRRFSLQSLFHARSPQRESLEPPMRTAFHNPLSVVISEPDEDWLNLEDARVLDIADVAGMVQSEVQQGGEQSGPTLEEGPPATSTALEPNALGIDLPDHEAAGAARAEST